MYEFKELIKKISSTEKKRECRNMEILKRKIKIRSVTGYGYRRKN